MLGAKIVLWVSRCFQSGAISSKQHLRLESETRQCRVSTGRVHRRTASLGHKLFVRCRLALLSGRRRHTIAHGSQGSQFLFKLASESALSQTPSPVAGWFRRNVHSRFTSQAQHILQRHDGHASYRSIGGPNERPGDIERRAHVGFDSLSFMGASGLPPSQSRVVVVRAGVDNAVRRIILRQIDVSAGVAEGKLQDLHSRDLQALSQGMNFRRDHAQVFGDKRQLANPLPQNAEQIVARTFPPAAMDRSGLRRGDFPIALKAAEMIQAQDVTRPQSPRDPLCPPLVTSRAAGFPSVERIAPTLSRGAECVRRDAGNQRRLKALVEREELRVAPHVSTVIVDEDGDVAHDAYAVPGTIAMQRPPLFEESKLDGAFHLELTLVLHAEAVHALGFAAGQLPRPRTPYRAAMGPADDLKQHKIFQPPG